MSARVEHPPRDAAVGSGAAVPSTAVVADLPAGVRARLVALVGGLRASVQRHGLARALLVLLDPWVLAGAGLLGIGVATWIRDQDASFPMRLPFDVPVALFGAVVLAGRLGERRVHQRTAHLQVLQAASARMSRATSVEAVGRAIVEEMGGIVDYHNARVYVLEPPDQVVPIAFEGRVGAYDDVDFELLRCTLGQGFTGWVAEHGVPLKIDDANVDPRGQTIPGTDDVDESMLVVPMRYDERVVGVITLSKLGLRQFGADDLQLLSILSDQAATALETARLLARSQGLAAELRRLVDMGSALSGSLDPRQVGVLIARHLAGAVGAAECAISTWDREGDRVCTVGYHPADAPAATTDSFDLGRYPATRVVLETQRPLVVQVDDPDADQAEVGYLRQTGFATLVMLPLVSKGQSIGLCELYAVAPVEVDPSLLELAVTMANEAAMALENATLYERARELADHDPLTGFFNHRYLQERLAEELLRAGRTRSQVSLLMLDLDAFKLVNDTLGHLLGDRVLTWTADLIRSTLRGSDIPARYGGDEFAVILPDTDPSAARAVAERMLAAFTEASFLADARDPVPVGLSIGLATYPVDGPSPTALIEAADGALYRVKRDGGRGCAAA